MNESFDWNAVAALSQVGGTIATTAAVFVSLQLARRDYRAHLRIRCQIATTRPGDPSAGFINIAVSNLGGRAERLNSLGWALQKRGSRFVFKPSEASAHQLPVVVKPGEQVEFVWTARDFERCSGEMRDWIRRKRRLGIIYRHVKVFVGTASGDECRARVSHNVQLLFATGDSFMLGLHELRIIQ